MPSPMETELRVHDSPVPTQMTCVFLGSICTSPMDCTGCLSKTGLKVVPPSWLFQTPPLAAPTNSKVFPPTFLPATAEMRPLIVADPMLRAFNPEMTPESIAGAFAALLGAGASASSGAGFFGGTMARAPGPAGKRKIPSSTGTLTSTLSSVNRCVFGAPLRPDSTEVGNQTPLTCAYAP